MSFVVDGSEWNFDGWLHGDVAQALDRMLERVQIASDRQETIWIGEDLQTKHVLGELDIWSLSSPESGICFPPEFWQELSAWLSRAPRYLDDDWPEDFPEPVITLDDETIAENFDVAWAHHNVRAERAVACLGLTRRGPHRTTSELGTVVVHWVNDEETHRNFWRAALIVEGDREETLVRFAPHAFPDLYFQANVWGGLGNIGGGYLALRSEIQRYLSILDDNGAWAFSCPPPALVRSDSPGSDPDAKPSNQIVERRFRGLNLDMAPENPDVYLNGRCRRAREIHIGPKTLYCEWHGKLEPHKNRVHVHPPTIESLNKVIIAIFHEHLPLPGD